MKNKCKKAGHGREWYYTFGNQQNFVTMITWLQQNMQGGMVKFPSIDQCVTQLEPCIQTS